MKDNLKPTKRRFQPGEGIEPLIRDARGFRVILDSDLAGLFGVTTGRLNQAVKRNASRFPSDFAFQLEPREVRNLMSQTVISRLHGGRRTLPWVFTEHGVLMLGNVLNSSVAVAASVRVVRVFVSMREQLAAHKEPAAKLAELESQVNGRDQSIQDLFEAIRRLVNPPPNETRKEIGFHIRERAPVYRVRTQKRF